ncbi:FH1/FH2 domain-containing protein 3 [Engraulis encrasicolus]|uniref:FH1/FH2 domain-containing protein 3 n=1 Tax=Engraulis encrasicolus TaxID=184585 RepID=UPI002FD1EFE0
MASFECRVQFLDDTDPFNSTNFPEPTRPPHYTFREDIPLINQIAGVHRLLKAPHKLDDCALQLSHNGTYLDLESSLAEQRDELEGFQEDSTSGRGKKHSVILRTQLSVRVHACIEKLYNSNGRDLRRALFSLKQIFQDDKDLVHEFVMAEGLTCLIKVGAEADQNYQNYILRALGQIMLYVDGMNGVIGHNETVQWLYTLIGSKFRLVVKTALKLLLVFVEYAESNATLLIQAIANVDVKRGRRPWGNAMEILDEKDGVDTELLVYAMTLINKTLSALPDQDSFYDMVDLLEEQGMDAVSKRHLGRKGTDLDLVEQLNIYEAALRHEDGDDDSEPPPSGCRDRRRTSVGGGGSEKRSLERRRSRRHSLGRPGHASPLSPASPHRPGAQPFNGQKLDERGLGSFGDQTLNEADFGPWPIQSESSQQQQQPSLLASLLARRKSSIRVPSSTATAEVTARPLANGRLPYLPHSPFHLFSYDLEEDTTKDKEEETKRSPGRSPQQSGDRNGKFVNPPSTAANKGESRPALGGLLSSSYRQHQESLAAEREKRRQDREDRLHKIERQERNRFSRDYVDKMEEARQAREERYKTVERLAAEEYERDRVRPAPRGLNLSLSPDDSCQSSRSVTPTSSQDIQDTPTTPYEPSESGAELEADEKEDEAAEQDEEVEEAEQEEEVVASEHTSEQEEAEETEEAAPVQEGEEEEEPAAEEEEGEELRQEVANGEAAEEDSGILSDKERQNEEVNEKDNCSASSISSASSTLEREERLAGNNNETGQWTTQSVKDADVNEQCSNILNSKLFMLDMLYAQTKKPAAEEEEEEEEEGEGEKKEKGQVEKEENENSSETTTTEVADKPEGEEQEEGEGGDESAEQKSDADKRSTNVRAFAEKFGDLVKGLTSPTASMESTDTPTEKAPQPPPPPPPPPPPKKESDTIWDQLLASPRELRIGDIDFTDLGDEDDQDLLDSGSLMSSSDLHPPPPPPPCPFSIPPPPPPFGCPPPPPMFGGGGGGVRMPPPPPCFSTPPAPPSQTQVPEPGSEQPLFQKKKKTIRLFWSEVRPDWQYGGYRRLQGSLWAKLEPVKVDTAKLEHLFESKSKEIPVTKKTAADGKRTEIIVLDSKRSNAINIGLTVLPPPRTIKTAILNFDEYALNKEGIEKILTMIPSEEEKQKIQEAQLANPDIPLGSAEQFLLTLSSISELSARLQLWAFKMDYEVTEKEVAEPLQDLKEGMDQLEKNKTLRHILSTLLAIGNFLNASSAKGFDLSYLEKVPEVKDTVHKQSLLHHACAIVVENYPESTDLYSEIGAITRSAKVDFDQLHENLKQMERRCKASWDHLKVIAKHEMKPALKQKMSDFLKDCAERIIILKIVHRRIMNRFHAFLLFLGHPAYGVRDISVHRFSKIVSEFALEYRTTRDRVLQQKQKRADHRERNKTRGKMIMDVNAPSDDEEDMESGRLGGSGGGGGGGSSSGGHHSGGSGGSGLAPEMQQPQGLGHAEDAAEHEFMKAVLKSSRAGGGQEEASLVPGQRLRTRTRPTRAAPNLSSRAAWSSAANEDGGMGMTDDAADEIMERIVRSATQGPRERAQPRERRRSRANRKSLRRTLKNGLTPEEAQALGLSENQERPI